MSTMEQRFAEFANGTRGIAKGDALFWTPKATEAIAFARSEVARREEELMAPGSELDPAVEAVFRAEANGEFGSQYLKEFIAAIDRLRAAEKLLRERVAELASARKEGYDQAIADAKMVARTTVSLSVSAEALDDLPEIVKRIRARRAMEVPNG
jgi:hypothetical protein